MGPEGLAFSLPRRRILMPTVPRTAALAMNCGERLKVVASEGQDEGVCSKHEQTLPAGYHLEREATEPCSKLQVSRRPRAAPV